MILGLGFVALAIVGTLTRVVTVARYNQAVFPFGTLAVNLVGSFLIGLLYEASPETLTLLGIACLGSFTTFSTLAHESVVMAEEKRTALAAAYLALTLVGGVAAAASGIALST